MYARPRVFASCCEKTVVEATSLASFSLAGVRSRRGEDVVHDVVGDRISRAAAGREVAIPGRAEPLGELARHRFTDQRDEFERVVRVGHEAQLRARGFLVTEGDRRGAAPRRLDQCCRSLRDDAFDGGDELVRVRDVLVRDPAHAITAQARHDLLRERELVGGLRLHLGVGLDQEDRSALLERGRRTLHEASQLATAPHDRDERHVRVGDVEPGAERG